MPSQSQPAPRSLGNGHAPSSDTGPGARGGPDRLVPVILSGGSGSRLWPLSRDSMPKQLWPLASQRTLLQEALSRARGPLPGGVLLAPPLVVCNDRHRFVVAAQLQAAGAGDARLLLEPSGRNSAPAVAAAALLLAEEDPEALVWVLPCDSVLADLAPLHARLPLAAAAARRGHVVCFGARMPPVDGRGPRLRVGAMLDEVPGVFRVAGFEDDAGAAAGGELPDARNLLWRTGMIVATAMALLRAIGAGAPEVVRRAAPAVARRRHERDFIRLDAESFDACPEIGLEEVIAAGDSSAVVVPVDLERSAIVGWDGLWRAGQRDPEGNVVLGDAVLLRAEDCYVRSEGPLTAVIGLRDIVVVATGDAVLAMHRDRADELREVVERLRRIGRREGVAHRRAARPWGHCESLALDGRYQVKRLVVRPGGALGLRRHLHRAEHWVVVEGTALVTCDGKERVLRESESIHLPLGAIHRLENPGLIPLTLIEVQLGSYLGDDDVVGTAEGCVPA